MARRRKSMFKSKFWLIYTIVAGVFSLAIVCGLFVFYDFMDAFEMSQPQSAPEAAKKFVTEMSADDIHSIVLENIPSGSTSGDKIANEYADAWNIESVFCRRVANEGSDDSPVYSVISNNREICKITLKKESLNRYNFSAWKISDISVSFDNFTIYTVTAPSGATVTVNGEILNTSAVVNTNVPYKYPEIQAGAADLPYAVRYKTDLLEGEPVVEVTLNGEKLETVLNGSEITAAYPEKLLYSCEIRVPAGAEVVVGDKKLDTLYEKVTESAFGGLIAEGLTVPEFDIYTVTGLYAPLSGVKVSSNGSELTYTEEKNEYKQKMTVDISSVSNQTVANFSNEFIMAYFNYTAQGFNNTEQNMYKALAYVLPGSDTYARIMNALNGYTYQTPVTKEVFNRLECVRMYKLEDGSFVVTFAFDIYHEIYSEKREYKGEFSLHVVDSYGNYKISNMVIIND